MIKCPFCYEIIEDDSIKCNYCGETLENSKGIKNIKTYSIGKKEYKNYVIIWMIGIVLYTILLAMKLNNISNIILLLASIILFYGTILRYHDLKKRGFYAFLLYIPIVCLFIIIDLISIERKNESIEDKINYKKDTIITMLIHLILVLIVIPMFLIYTKFPLL